LSIIFLVSTAEFGSYAFVQDSWFVFGVIVSRNLQKLVGEIFAKYGILAGSEDDISSLYFVRTEGTSLYKVPKLCEIRCQVFVDRPVDG